MFFVILHKQIYIIINKRIGEIVNGEVPIGTPRKTQADNPTFMQRFTTSDIIVISMFGAAGIVAGILGNVLHGASGLMPFIGAFILHTLIPGIILFSCISTVRKAGSATLVSLISSLIAMPLMGAPLFIPFYLVQGLLADGMIVGLKERMWTPSGISLAAIVYGTVGILMLYYFVLRLQGLEFPLYVVLPSIPLNIVFAIPAALIGLKLGTRASAVLAG
jgi:hypothetical protein